MRYLKIYSIFLKQYLKGLLEYRIDFLIGMFAFLLDQSLGIFFLSVIFQHIDLLAGFSFQEIVLMYGLSQIPKGIDHLFFDNIWLLPRVIRQGDLDRYLLRPINSLYHFLIVRFQPDAFGEIILGIILTSYGISHIPGLALMDYITFILALMLFMLIGTFIFTGLKLMTASLSFWLTNAYPVMQITYNLNQFARYPVIIFPKFIRLLMTYIIPFAFVAYYPVLFIKGEESFISILGELLLITSLFMSMGVSLWNKGIKNYNSTGS
ncbi:MAG: multidrug transporter permease [Haloplasmataceae bacterium]|jgi:ABC-2 type transport system permease protein|nr:multidrug transporter permease [Haloplasmataceae bacterium]